MTSKALILTDGLLDSIACKTAHGLILGRSRYTVVGVVDNKYTDKDAGEVISGQATDTPIFASIDQALRQLDQKPDFCVVGVAPIGGRLSDSLVHTIMQAIDKGINIVSGLHSLLIDNPKIVAAAKQNHVTLTDIRKPKPLHELSTWSGKITQVKTPRIAVIGTDCAIGKRTTAGLLLDLCSQHQIKAEMIYTGQTGWLQGMPYGFILDATVNDFVAGEMEHAVLSCDQTAKPDLIFLEGQSALRNPAGPCGAEYICSAGAKYVILQHSPAREHYLYDTTFSYKIPELQDEIALIENYGAKVVAITLNSKDLHADELARIKQKIQSQTQLPVIYPREEGVEALLPVLQDIIRTNKK